MGHAFDRQAVLDRFGGDLGLLRQIAELFRGSSGPWLTEIRAAAACVDMRHVKRVAHTLKGSVGNFLATDAAAAARDVQELAAAGNPIPLGDAITHLEKEVDRLNQALDELIQQP